MQKVTRKFGNTKYYSYICGPNHYLSMVKLKNEQLKTMNDLDQKIRSAVMNLLMHRFGIPKFDAEDILQDAWVLLMEKLMMGALPEVPEKLQAYMLNVCDKKAHEYLRKKTYEYDETSLDDETMTAEKLESIQKEIQSWVDYIEEQEKARERKISAIEQEILKLSPRQRVLLEGYYFENKSMRELAQQLGYKSEDVAKSTKKRIIDLIRATVKQQERANRSRLSPAAFLLFIHVVTDLLEADKDTLHLLVTAAGELLIEPLTSLEGASGQIGSLDQISGLTSAAERSTYAIGHC